MSLIKGCCIMNMLNRIRSPGGKLPRSKALLYSVSVTAFGFLIGTAAKLFDIYTTNLGNIFSQMSVWIFICVLIAVFSNSPLRAAINVLLFCVGMLASYYITAELLSSFYSMRFVFGWSLVALISPILGFCTWYAKGKGAISKIIASAVIVVMLVLSAALFEKIRISDIVLAVITGFVLFKK